MKAIRITQLIFPVFFFVLLVGACSKNSDPENQKIFECSDIQEFISLMQSSSYASDYVVSYSIQESYYSFEFHSNGMIELESDCVSRISEITDKSQLRIKFNSNSTVELAYLNNVEFNYTHNPNGVTPLSGEITISSSLPGQLMITVKAKKEGQENLTHVFESKGNNHQLPILGMYYNHRNIIYMNYFDDEKTYYRDTLEYVLGERPTFLPTVIADVNQQTNAEPGMHFVSYRSFTPTNPFIFDNTGEFRYVLNFASDPRFSNLNYDVGMERLQNGNYYFGAWPTSFLYEIDVLGNVINEWNISPYEFHHNVQEKENGNLLITASLYDEHADGGLAIEDWILELDRNSGTIVNQWDLKESLDENREILGWAVYSNIIDWAHANAVIHDPSDNSIIVSCRTQGVVKLDENNNVVWILGNHKAWGTNRRGEDLNQFLLQPLDNSGAEITDQRMLEGERQHPDFEWPWYQHAPFISDNGTLFLFDNGDNRNYSPSERYSRAVEYEIDETNRTIRQVWQYGKERGVEAFSRIVSDVDQLEQTGNILFCPGSRVFNGGGNFGGKIIEVDYDTKEVIQEFRINAPDIVFHRTEKLPLYPSNY